MIRGVPIVTTSWDDGDPKDLKIADLLSSRGLAGTFYIPMIGYLGRKTLTNVELRALSDQGFEVGGHSVSHTNLPSLSPERLDQEVGTCKQKLEQVTGRRVLMFCYPNGRYNRKVVRHVEKAGYQGARTVHMLSIGAKFLPFEMPTTLQAYPHSAAAYIGNATRARNVPALTNYITRLRRLRSWTELGMQLFREVKENGGIWHLYGHSWEVEELNLWSGLRELLDYVSHRNDVRYVNNSALLQYNSAGQVAFGTPANAEPACPA
jgi:peptidoglycan/xylan/chitin deacetylase (PgdA/CDA1 family)